jgi:hypothetical protein
MNLVWKHSSNAPSRFGSRALNRLEGAVRRTSHLDMDAFHASVEQRDGAALDSVAPGNL